MRQKDGFLKQKGMPGKKRGGKKLSGHDAGCTFAGYCDGWLKGKALSIKTSSLIKYERDMENHIKPFFGGRMPGNITSGDVEAFTQMLLEEQHLAPCTVRGILVVLDSILAYAEKKTGFRQPRPEVLYPRANRKTVRVLDRGEEERLMQFLLKKMDLCRLGVYMAMRTGMRIGELCALRWCDISFETCTIFIHYTAQRIKSADADACTKTRLILGSPKSDSSDRAIPLMPDLEALCSRFCPEDPKIFLLTGTRQCMDPRKLQRRLKKYTDECGLEGIHFHTLRHTFATRCVESGFDVKTLSEILGHSDIGITMNRYVHPDMDSKRANMRRLETTVNI